MALFEKRVKLRHRWLFDRAIILSTSVHAQVPSINLSFREAWAPSGTRPGPLRTDNVDHMCFAWFAGHPALHECLCRLPILGSTYY